MLKTILAVIAMLATPLGVSAAATATPTPMFGVIIPSGNFLANEGWGASVGGTTETTLAQGNLPAQAFSPGRIFRFLTSGAYASSVTPNITLSFYVDTQIIVATTLTVASGDTWYFCASMTGLTSGLAGTVRVEGRCDFGGATPTTFQANAPVIINTGAVHQFRLTAAWSAPDVATLDIQSGFLAPGN